MQLVPEEKPERVVLPVPEQVVEVLAVPKPAAKELQVAEEEEEEELPILDATACAGRLWTCPQAQSRHYLPVLPLYVS